MSKIKHQKLGQFASTAICGNDILSSALYVSGIAALFAGFYAPVVLLGVALVLVFYRSVYREVVEALPVNGGAYNALLNSTSKVIAAIAGIMTILSYIATAVISAKTAVEYLFYFLRQFLPHYGINLSLGLWQSLVAPSVILVLLFFAILVSIGVKDSAKVAIGIFAFHVLTLASFLAVGAAYFFIHGPGIGLANLAATHHMALAGHGTWRMLFFGFAASLLGVSGFESSANFVEEQQPGVFKKTLRNMTIGVMIFNPLLALVTLNVLPLGNIAAAKDFLLADTAFKLGHLPFLSVVSLDAFLVLCGAVLTSFVGVSGLVYRMSLDDALPRFLRRKSKQGGTPRIIWTFFLLCVSILILTKGNLLSLAGVYTISFLSVMTLFAIGNIILRLTRPELKRPYQAQLLFVVVALSMTLAGLMGNIAIDLKNVVYFLTYFLPAVLIVMSIIFRKELYRNLRLLFYFIAPLRRYFEERFREVTERTYYVFLHHTHNIYNALRYVNDNEGGHNIVFVHCKSKETGQKESIRGLLPALKKAGVMPHFNIRFDYFDQVFSPAAVNEYVEKNKISPSQIFIGSIHHFHDFEYSDFNGVRIIGE